jgi:hypothetical protein
VQQEKIISANINMTVINHICVYTHTQVGIFVSTSFVLV